MALHFISLLAFAYLVEFRTIVVCQSSAEVSVTATEQSITASLSPENVYHSLTVQSIFSYMTLTLQDLSSVASAEQPSSVISLEKASSVVNDTNGIENTVVYTHVQHSTSTNIDSIASKMMANTPSVEFFNIISTTSDYMLNTDMGAILSSRVTSFYEDADSMYAKSGVLSESAASKVLLGTTSSEQMQTSFGNTGMDPVSKEANPSNTEHVILSSMEIFHSSFSTRDNVVDATGQSATSGTLYSPQQYVSEHSEISSPEYQVGISSTTSVSPGYITLQVSEVGTQSQEQVYSSYNTEHFADSISVASTISDSKPFLVLPSVTLVSLGSGSLNTGNVQTGVDIITSEYAMTSGFTSSLGYNIFSDVPTETVTQNRFLSPVTYDISQIQTTISPTGVLPTISLSPSQYLESIFFQTSDTHSSEVPTVLSSANVNVLLSASSSSFHDQDLNLYSSPFYSESSFNITQQNETQLYLNISRIVESSVFTINSVTESSYERPEGVPSRTIGASIFDSSIDDITFHSSIEPTFGRTNMSVLSTGDAHSPTIQLTITSVSSFPSEASESLSFNVTDLAHTVSIATNTISPNSYNFLGSSSSTYNGTGVVDKSLNFTDISLSHEPTSSILSVMETDNIFVTPTGSTFHSSVSVISPSFEPVTSLSGVVEHSLITEISANMSSFVLNGTELNFSNLLTLNISTEMETSTFYKDSQLESGQFVNMTMITPQLTKSSEMIELVTPSIKVTKYISASSALNSLPLSSSTNNSPSDINITDVTETQQNTNVTLSLAYSLPDSMVDTSHISLSSVLTLYSEPFSQTSSIADISADTYLDVASYERSLFTGSVSEIISSEHIDISSSISDINVVHMSTDIGISVTDTFSYSVKLNSSLLESVVLTQPIETTDLQFHTTASFLDTATMPTTLFDSMSRASAISSENQTKSLSTLNTDLISPTSSFVMSSEMYQVNQTDAILPTSLESGMHTLADSFVQLNTSFITPTLVVTPNSSSVSHTILQTSTNISISDSFESVTLPSLNMTMPITTESLNASAIPNITYTLNITDTMNTTVSMLMTATVEVNGTDLNMTDTNVTETITTIDTTTETSTEPPTTTTTVPETTTTTEPTTTTPDLIALYWMKTAIKVPTKENVSHPDFQTKIEVRMAELYDTAVQREAEIAAGTYVERKRRRKRFASSGNVAVNMQSIDRTVNTTEVTLVYTLENNGTNVTVSDALKTLDVISDQEMAIKLQYVVLTKAAPFVDQPDIPTTPATSSTTVVVPTAIVTQESSKLWIIGVVIGVVALIIIGIWVALCIVTKSKAKQETDDKVVEPRLTNLKSPIIDQERQEFTESRKGSQDMAEKGSSSGLKVQSPKKQSYEVNPDQDSVEEEKHVYTEVKKSRRPESGSYKSLRSDQSGGHVNDSYTNISEDTELIGSPKKHKKADKGKRKKKIKDKDHFDDVGDVVTGPEEEITVKTIHPTTIPEYLLTVTQKIPEYYSAEDEDEIKQRKEAERKRNKQRIREKKKKERKRHGTDGDDLMKEYLAAQEEIDEVLEAPKGDNQLPDVFIHKSPERKAKRTGETNEAFSAEDTLNEARNRMHRLLDDAFSLISPSASSLMGQAEDEGFHSPRTQSPKSQIRLLNERNKVSPADPETSSLGDSYEDDDNMEEIKEEKKHSPMTVTSYKPSEKALTTWSPYRASDEVALISMPTKLQTSVGKADSSKRGKRPAAVLTDKPRKSKHNDKYTTDPPKPIVLKTRDLMSTRDSIDKTDDVKRETSKSKTVPNGVKTGIGGEDLAQRRARILNSSDGQNSYMSPSQMNGKDIRKHSTANAVEMKEMNGDYLKERTKKHRGPSRKTQNSEDETDVVVKTVSSGNTPEATLQSIRDELRGIVSVRQPSRGRGGYGRMDNNSGSLADIA